MFKSFAAIFILLMIFASSDSFADVRLGWMPLNIREVRIDITDGQYIGRQWPEVTLVLTAQMPIVGDSLISPRNWITIKTSKVYGDPKIMGLYRIEHRNYGDNKPGDIVAVFGGLNPADKEKSFTIGKLEIGENGQFAKLILNPGYEIIAGIEQQKAGPIEKYMNSKQDLQTMSVYIKGLDIRSFRP